MKTAEEWRVHLSRMWFGGFGSNSIPKNGILEQLLTDMETLEQKIDQLEQKVEDLLDNTLRGDVY